MRIPVEGTLFKEEHLRKTRTVLLILTPIAALFAIGAVAALSGSWNPRPLGG